MEIMSEDGTMSRLPELRKMADEWGLKLISIRDLIAYRLKQELSLIHIFLRSPFFQAPISLFSPFPPYSLFLSSFDDAP